MFKLKEAVVPVREQEVLVRELTQAERVKWVKSGQEDKFRGPAILVSLGCVEPAFTEEEAHNLPSEVVTELASAIMEISGFNSKEKDKKEKETNARREVPVSSQSGVGDSSK